MKCVVCGNIGKITVEIKNEITVMVCKGCNDELLKGDLTKGDLYISYFANLNKRL